MKIENLTLKIPNSQGTAAPIEGPTELPTGGLGIGSSGTNLIQVAINLLFVFGIILAVVFILISGIQMIISGGEKQKVQNARNRLIYSIVGLVIIFLAFLIRNIIVTLLGADTKFFLNTP